MSLIFLHRDKGICTIILKKRFAFYRFKITMANTTKDYVLALLNEFVEDRPLAKGLKLLVESWSMDDKMLDGLAQIFQSVVHSVATKEDSAKFQKGYEYLQKIKEIEEQEHQKDLSELDSLLEDI